MCLMFPCLGRCELVEPEGVKFANGWGSMMYSDVIELERELQEALVAEFE